MSEENANSSCQTATTNDPTKESQVENKPDPWKIKPVSTLRVVLHLLNAILVIVSVSAIIAAIYDLSILSSYSQVARGRNRISGIIVIVAVTIGIGLTLYGSYSAVKRKRQGLHVVSSQAVILTYLVFRTRTQKRNTYGITSMPGHLLIFKFSPPREAGGLSVLLVVLLAVAVAVLVQRPSEEAFLKDRLAESFAKAPSSHEDRDGWDKVHQSLSCCGNTGPRDFSFPNTPPHVPPEVALSCCTNFRKNATHAENERARKTCIHQKLYYRDGCQKLVSDLFENSSNGVVSSVIILAIVQLVAAILAVKLSGHVKCSKKSNIDQSNQPKA